MEGLACQLEIVATVIRQLIQALTTSTNLKSNITRTYGYTLIKASLFLDCLSRNDAVCQYSKEETDSETLC